MNIKKMVKLSFILIGLLVLLIFFANSIILYQLKENNLSKNSISKLVSMQENMNSLVKDILNTHSIEELNLIKKSFFSYEKEFEHIKESFFENNENDVIDFFINDIHEYPIVKTNLELLYNNEKEIEKAFAYIFTTQREKIELHTLFNAHYPTESKIRNTLEKQILETKNIMLIKDLGDIKYYSKEMLFQHQNQEYFDKWLNEIKLLEKLHPSVDYASYYAIAQQVGGYILNIKELEKQEDILQSQMYAIVNDNQKINTLIEEEIDYYSGKFIDTINLLVLLLLGLTIGFIVILAYKVNKNVALSVDEIEQKVDEGLQEIKHLNKEIEETQKEVIFTMGAIGESRSKETGNHVKRVAQYSKLLALHYGLSSKEAHMLKLASPMHDIGKVAIADAILNKPGRFDAQERTIMETHAKLGYDMLKHSQRALLKMAAIISYEHHEKWDGTGYPQGKKSEDIHIYGRITALADVFDALGSDRCYKKAWDDEKIFALFKEERGKHFDPKLVDIFFEHLHEFLKIRDTFKDN
jgi:response regulator RpfG family c-di-GMP phosphodiesterase